MAHGHGGLGNDRPPVQLLGHVVAGGPNQLHAPLPGPVIGLGALEGRQERVVDVDHSMESIRWIKALQKCRRQHLHVLGQDHQLDAVLGKQL